jgi:hypothetical protein
MFQKIINNGTILGNVRQTFSLITLRLYDSEAYYHKQQLDNAFTNLKQHISNSNFVNKLQMLTALNDIQIHFNHSNNTETIKQLLKQVTSDTKTISKQSVYSTLIQFLIIGKLIDSTISMPSMNSISTIINGKNYWIYHIADSTALPKNMVIALFLNYFIMNRNHCPIYNGVVFLSNILHEGTCDGQHCNTHIVRDSYKNIKLDFMNDNQTYENFMYLQNDKNIELQCGNNVTNVFKLQDAIQIL